MKHFFYLLFLSVAVWGCKDEEPILGNPPNQSEAIFSYEASADNANIINFTSFATGTSQILWDFGNGTQAEGKTVQGIFPIKGIYEVKVDIFAKGGSVSSTQLIEIENDDLTLLQDSLLTWLTGGVDSIFGKTWVIDSNSTTHFGVGPDQNHPDFDGFYPKWYSAAPNEKSGVGLYNDSYNFKLVGFGFDMITNGDIYVHADHQSGFSGAYQNKGDYTAPYPDQLNSKWQIAFDPGADTTLTFPSNSWLGMNTRVNTYKILSISNNHLFLVYKHDGNPDLAWYLRLIPKGFIPSGGNGGGGGSTGFSLPIDFETIEPTFTAFGNSSVQIINNPDARPGSINTSIRVLETTHGDETWAGVSVDLDSKLSFANDSLIKIKVWAEKAGVFKVKLEDKDNPNVSIEKEVNIPVSFSWIEISVGFNNSNSGLYDKIALFPGWNTTTPDKYYIDDIKQSN